MRRITKDRPGLSSLYGDPSALWVWLNVWVSCVALFPYILLAASRLLLISISYLDGLGTVFWMVALFALSGIGRAGYIVCVPVVGAACIFVAGLLYSSKITWRIKLVTISVELSALALMYSGVGLIMTRYGQGKLEWLYR